MRTYSKCAGFQQVLKVEVLFVKWTAIVAEVCRKPWDKVKKHDNMKKRKRVSVPYTHSRKQQADYLWQSSKRSYNIFIQSLWLSCFKQISCRLSRTQCSDSSGSKLSWSPYFATHLLSWQARLRFDYRLVSSEAENVTCPGCCSIRVRGINCSVREKKLKAKSRKKVGKALKACKTKLITRCNICTFQNQSIGKLKLWKKFRRKSKQKSGFRSSFSLPPLVQLQSTKADSESSSIAELLQNGTLIAKKARMNVHHKA